MKARAEQQAAARRGDVGTDETGTWAAHVKELTRAYEEELFKLLVRLRQMLVTKGIGASSLASIQLPGQETPDSVLACVLCLLGDGELAERLLYGASGIFGLDSSDPPPAELLGLLVCRGACTCTCT